MFLFKKKDDKKQEIPAFSLNDPRIAELSSISAKDLLDDPSMARSLQKLVLWLNNHPKTTEVISFKILDKRMYPNDVLLKQQILKSELYSAVKLVMKMEKTIQDGPVKATPELTHPCPQYQDVKIIQELWRKCKILESILLEYRTEINRFCWEYTKELKDTVAYCSSLLASQDAFPQHFLPIVDFDKLNLSNEIIASFDPNCFDLVKQSSLIEVQQSQLLMKINTIQEALNNTETPVSVFLETVLQTSHENMADAFEDFLWEMKPRFQFISNFFTTPNNDTFYHLCNGILENFSVTPDKWSLVMNLCFEVAAPYAAPIIVFNGKGCENFDVEILGFEAAIQSNPLKLLRMIGSTENGGLVQEGLKAVTSSWKEFYNFAINFCDQDRLSKTDIECRNTAIAFYE